jgi:siderophore synthetase component
MSIRMVIELSDRDSVQTVVQALEAYKVRLRTSITPTKRRLETYETRYGIDTKHFLHEMTAEDLQDGDLEYVEWAGEAKLLEGLEAELRALEHASYHVS